jgi:imidazolonepropionase-like amidohydrolase
MSAKIHLRCGKLFKGIGDDVLLNHTIVVQNGVVVRVAPTDTIPAVDGVLEYDYSRHFVMPGMIDVHTHLAYGNAKTEEDIDIYSSLEFRTLRGMFFSQHTLASGFTSIVAPGGSGNVSSAIRDAVDAGLFEGPSVTAAGPYITSRQGLTDWYPSWIGAPSTSIGRLVRNRDEAIDEVRRQVKDGVDSVKLALDGLHFRSNGELVAAFTLDETKAMVDEIHRLGKTAIAHAKGREAVIYAGKAGVDLIFHASWMDDEGLEAVVANNCAIAPTLTLLRNTMDFIQPHDPATRSGMAFLFEAEFYTAIEALKKAKAAGVRMPIGTDSGFAVTPYGEWHARELAIFVEHLGFTPIEALRAATSVGASVVRPTDRVGTLAAGYRADILVVDGDPTEDITILMEQSKIAQVFRGGKIITPPRREYDPNLVSDRSYAMFNDLYTRERVAQLGLLNKPQ